MPRKQRVDRQAIELKTWFKHQSRFRTLRELAERVGIPYSTLRDYFNGRAVPTGRRLESLASLTDCPSLRGPASALAPPPTDTTIPGPAASGPSAVNTDAALVLHAIRLLIQSLESFKRGTREDREALRRMVPKRDVGYVTTLMKALYDEDEFQTWLYFTEYQPAPR